MRTQPKQLELPLMPTHGGKRAGAGRKNRSGLQAHSRRPALASRHPVHVTLKLAEGLPSLRRKDTFRILREAVKKARKQGFQVAHFAILSNHVHLILEPKEPTLARVFQSLCISFAKRLNRQLQRDGEVFRGRYQLHVLRTPTEVRRALTYVLTNESKHRKARKPEVTLDPFSSALAFTDWRKLLGPQVEFTYSNWPEQAIEAWHELLLAPPRTWLLQKGWMKAAA